MSAYIVSKRHIDALVCGAVGARRNEGLIYSYQGTRHLSSLEADYVGRMLWSTNLASVAYRYPEDKDGSRPGPCDFRDADIAAYTFWLPTAPVPSPVELLKLIDCYEYQSCEHPEWEGSEAQWFCRVLQTHTISRLPGYEEAAWAL